MRVTSATRFQESAHPLQRFLDACSRAGITEPHKAVAVGAIEVDDGGSFLSAYNKYLVPNEELVGLGTAVGSRLIPEANFVGESNQEQLLDAMMQVVNTVGQPFPLDQPLLYTYGAPVQFLVTSPYNYKDDGTSAVTPAWRNSIWHGLINSAFF